MKGLYIHIPFCIKKCLYCDFNSYEGMSEIYDSYTDALITHIGRVKPTGVTTVYIGGGTPTVLSCGQLERLIRSLEVPEGIEFTVEANPKTLNVEKANLLYSLGVNRLSIGLQAWQDRLLKAIGRIHTKDDFLECLHIAQNVGFTNINVDVMFGLPGQSSDDLRKTVNALKTLAIPHVSCYSLTVAPNTPFYTNPPPNLPDEETEREMYDIVYNNFPMYEISNFAEDEYMCRHNLCYWSGNGYYAFGAGAYGYLRDVRFSWENDVTSYIKSVADNTITATQQETLTENDKMIEYAILALRMARGIDESEFARRFKLDFYQKFQQAVDINIKNGLMEQTPSGYRLTRRGIDLANTALCEFVGV